MKNLKKITTVMIGAVAVTTMLSACDVFTSTPVSGTVSENVVSATATVKALDLTTREVTLQRADGQTVTIYAGEQVRNLAQVKVGDTVRVTYYESLAYDVKKPGEGSLGVAAAEELTRAKPGEKPAGAAARVITITATITAIDKTAKTVTLKGPEGNSVTVKARDPKKLDRVVVGDLVNITYTEALAISVETPKK